MRTEEEIEEYSQKIREVIMRKCFKKHPKHSDCGCIQKVDQSIELFISCVPEAFWHIDSKSASKDKFYRKSIKPYKSNLGLALKNGYGMVLIGASGSGKTFWANYLLMAAFKKGFSVYYTTMAELKQHVLEARYKEGREVKEKLEWYFTSDFIAIDEIGSESAPSMEKGADRSDIYFYEFFKKLIKQRDENKRPLILTSKSSGKEVKTLYDDTIVSIISNKYGWVVLPEVDHRIKEKARMIELMGYQ